MSLKKVMLFYGVFSYTCSDSSSARSLYELQKVICIFLLKNTESTWYGVHKNQYGLSERLTGKARSYSFLCPFILYVLMTI